MKIKTTYHFAVLTLFCCLCSATQAQESRKNLPDQIKKGKWMISHDLFSIGYFNSKNTSYDNNDNKSGSEKTGKFYSSLSFSSPYWGSMGVNAGNTHRYDAVGNELEKIKASNFSIGITPSIGYFIRDRLMLGASVQLYYTSDYSKYSNSNGWTEYDYTYTTFGIGPQLRYYFGDLKKRQLFHAGISSTVTLRLNRQESTSYLAALNTTTKTVYKVNQPALSAEPYIGSTWFVGKHWTFTGSAFYATATDNYKLTNTTAAAKSRVKTNRTDTGIKGGVCYTF